MDFILTLITNHICQIKDVYKRQAYGAVVSFTTGRDDRGDLPGTGHGGTPWIWLLLFGASAAVLVALLVLSKRRKAIER